MDSEFEDLELDIQNQYTLDRPSISDKIAIMKPIRTIVRISYFCIHEPLPSTSRSAYPPGDP